MKIKCTKAGNISYDGTVLSVTVGQEFPCDETFSGLTDLYADMFELVQEKQDKAPAQKAPDAIKAVEIAETPEVKEAAPAAKSETLTEKAKKLFTK